MLLLNSIIKAGFSEDKASVGIVVDVTDKRKEFVLSHNRTVTHGDDLLPDVSNSNEALFTVLHTNHFTMICRCFVFGWKTTVANQKLGITCPQGKLSLPHLAQVEPAFAKYIQEGLRVIRLGPEILQYPHSVAAITSSYNLNLAMGETEGELLVASAEQLNMLSD